MTGTDGISGWLIAAAVVNLVFGGMWLIGFLFGIAETAAAPVETAGLALVLVSIVGVGICGGLAAVSFATRSVIRRVASERDQATASRQSGTQESISAV